MARSTGSEQSTNGSAIAAAHVAIENDSTSAEADADAADASSLSVSDWSSLTEPLLLDVPRRLHTLEEFSSFRAVCQSWRAAAPPTPSTLAAQHPLLLFTLVVDDRQALFDVIRGRRYGGALLPWRASSRFAFAYAHGYLATYTDDSFSGGAEIWLWHIFTRETICLPRVPLQFDRLFFSSNPGDSECLVLLLYTPHCLLQYLRIGDTLWTVADCSEQILFLCDMVFFKNKLYALNILMQLIAIDLFAGPKCDVFQNGEGTPVAIWENEFRVRALAVSGEELLAVCYNWDDRFDVFHWDFNRDAWEQIYTLGGRALFIGAEGFVGSLDASEVGVRGNSIYYMGDNENICSVFCLEDQSTVAASPDLYEQFQHGSLQVLPSWVLPSIC